MMVFQACPCGIARNDCEYHKPGLTVGARLICTYFRREVDPAGKWTKGTPRDLAARIFRAAPAVGYLEIEGVPQLGPDGSALATKIKVFGGASWWRAGILRAVDEGMPPNSTIDVVWA